MYYCSNYPTDINLEELLKKHEFSVTPRALFSPDGLAWKCRDKSSFLVGIETRLAGVTMDINVETEHIVGIDCIGIIYQLKIFDGIVTLEDLADQFVKQIKIYTRKFETIVLAFDQYNTRNPTLKQQTWDDRCKGTQVKYNLTARSVIKNIKLTQLLSHPVNKQRICNLFATKAIEMFNDVGKKFIVGYDTTITSNVSGWNHENHNHDEADTLLICMLNEMHRLHGGQRRIRIISPDTDVFMIAFDLSTKRQGIHFVFELMNSKETREIDVKKAVNHIGLSKSKGLLSAYVYSGCDQVGKFNTVSKARALTVYLDCCSDTMISGIQKLGDSFNITESTVKAMVEYTMLLYATKKEDREKLSQFGDTGDLRWHQLSKHQQDAYSLPPTPAALRFHMMRANYVCAVWKALSQEFLFTSPSTTDHGWETIDDKLIPIMTDESPAPDFSIELNSCGCQKTKCKTEKCSCLQNGLKCTDICNCLDCENVDMKFSEIGDIADV